MNDTVQTNQESNVKIIYILYLVSMVLPLTGLVGVVMAYSYRSQADELSQTHFTFLIRTFWIGALYMFVGLVLALFLIGYLVWLFCVIWLIIRCVKGMQFLGNKQPVPNPSTWMFN